MPAMQAIIKGYLMGRACLSRAIVPKQNVKVCNAKVDKRNKISMVYLASNVDFLWARHAFRMDCVTRYAFGLDCVTSTKEVCIGG